MWGVHTAATGLPSHKVASHASLFMSRQDVNIDLSLLRNFDDVFRVDLSPELAAAIKEKPCKEELFLMMIWTIVLDVGMQYVRERGLKFYPNEYRGAIDGITLGHHFLADTKDLPDYQLSYDSDTREYESVALDSYH